MDLALILIAGLAGAGLAAAWLWGLWWTLQRLPESRHPTLLLLASGIARALVVAVAVVAIGFGDWRRLVAALGGFLVTRVIVTMAVRVPPAGG